MAVFAGLFGYLTFHLYTLQIRKGSMYVKLAQSQERAGQNLEALRGIIYFVDKNNARIPAALNKEYPKVYAVPTEIQRAVSRGTVQRASIAASLSELFGGSSAEMEQRLSKKNDAYELLMQKATPEIIQRIEELNLPGVYVRNDTLRFYPSGALAAHALGFVSPQNGNETSSTYGGLVGRYGAELEFNALLRGTEGAARGDTLVRPTNGTDITLTIDRTIEAQAEELLQGIVKEYGATGGTVIVEEPKTGRILAMGSVPSFDPNTYQNFHIKDFLNPAVQLVYEPGSIFKLITMAAGIDSSTITPDTAYVDTGSVTLNGKTVANWDFPTHGPYGRQTMTNVIEHSINTGAVFAERRMGHLIFYDYLTRFGFHDPTGIALPGEVTGSIANVKQGRDIDYATASYGQGVSVTPLQLINAISAIANDGVLMKPLIRTDESPQVIRRVIASSTAREITTMMVSAVELNKLAAIPSYHIAGKTGTAFVPDFVTKRGYTDQVINTYVGFAPASAPRFVILIKLDKPKGSPLAGQTVVPAFRNLAQFLLTYYDMPPDGRITKQ